MPSRIGAIRDSETRSDGPGDEQQVQVRRVGGVGRGRRGQREPATASRGARVRREERRVVRGRPGVRVCTHYPRRAERVGSSPSVARAH
eukprot:6194922-Pleurochrysis_carterae.AAC.5